MAEKTLESTSIVRFNLILFAGGFVFGLVSLQSACVGTGSVVVGALRFSPRRVSADGGDDTIGMADAAVLTAVAMVV